MGKKKIEEKIRQAEEERARLMNMSEKELLVEILLTLQAIDGTSEGIATFAALDALRHH